MNKNSVTRSVFRRLFTTVISFSLIVLPVSSAQAVSSMSAPTSGTTTRDSVASDGTQGNDFSAEASISATGRFVAFNSPASTLVSGDTNGVPDVFVHDRKTGQTTRVSVASDGTEGNCNSDFPSLSVNGRYVAFDSCADNLVSGDSNGFVDTFVHDRATGQTTLVSVASDGTQGNESSSSHVSISANGRYVAFQSFASNLVSGDTNNTLDVFVHDRQTGQTTRVSVRSNGTQGNGLSAHPSISANGRYVAFASSASNLVNGDNNGAEDVFIHDRKTGRTTLVSVASDGTPGNGESAFPSLSANGHYVAFFSSASNLVSGDTNFTSDIFVHDRQTGRTTRVSVASDGTQANDGSGTLSISANGRYVAFESVASNLVSSDTNNSQDIFVHDRQKGQTTRVTVASDGTQGNGNSFDPYPASISANGRFVAFESVASNLVSDDTNGVTDFFVHDRKGGGSDEEPLPAELELEAGDY